MPGTKSAALAVYDDGYTGDEPVAIDDCSVDSEFRFTDEMIYDDGESGDEYIALADCSVDSAELEPPLPAETEASYAPDLPSSVDESSADDGCIDEEHPAGIDPIRPDVALAEFGTDDGSCESIHSQEAAVDFPIYEDGDVGYEPVADCESIDEENER